MLFRNMKFDPNRLTPITVFDADKGMCISVYLYLDNDMAYFVNHVTDEIPMRVSCNGNIYIKNGKVPMATIRGDGNKYSIFPTDVTLGSFEVTANDFFQAEEKAFMRFHELGLI